MLTQRFIIGQEDWKVVMLYDILPEDLPVVYANLRGEGAGHRMARNACHVLEGWNKGYTFSNHDIRSSVVCIGRATTLGQFFDSLLHEIKHLTEHISGHYKVDPKSEDAAYLQGEIGLQVWPYLARIIKCE